MYNKNSRLLPRVLEILSQKPNLRDALYNLCQDIERNLAEDNVKIKDVPKAIKEALSVGEKLGIITVTDKDVRVPFNFRAQSKIPPITKRSARGDKRRTNDYDDYAGNDNQLDDTSSPEITPKFRMRSVPKAPMDRSRRRSTVRRRVVGRRARGRGKSTRSRSRRVSRRRR